MTNKQQFIDSLKNEIADDVRRLFRSHGFPVTCEGEMHLFAVIDSSFDAIVAQEAAKGNSFPAATA